MVRVAFLFLLIFHGLIHLLGFLQPWHLLEISQLSGESILSLSESGSKFLGVIWLFTCLSFLTTAAAYSLKKDWWLFVGLLAVVVSQVLIVLYWPDAKFGTLANFFVMAGIVLGYASVSFDRMVRKEVKGLLGRTTIKTEVVTEEGIAGLPVPLQRWLKRAGVIGHRKVRSLHLEQQGRMRTKPGAAWMPVKAEQFFSVDPPGFVWVADVKAAPFVHLAGRDKYAAGHGHMLIKLLNIFPVADATGPETDQGTLLRFLAEIIWFPTAALEEYISWEEVDESTARATMSFGGTTASGLFTFDEAGDFRRFEARRYYERDLQTWVITSQDHQDLGGFRIPVASQVTWQLPEGDFTWFDLEITKIDYEE